MLIRIKLPLVLERNSQMEGRTGILDVYFPRLQMFYSMKSLMSNIHKINKLLLYHVFIFVFMLIK